MNRSSVWEESWMVAPPAWAAAVSRHAVMAWADPAAFDLSSRAIRGRCAGRMASFPGAPLLGPRHTLTPTSSASPRYRRDEVRYGASRWLRRSQERQALGR